MAFSKLDCPRTSLPTSFVPAGRAHSFRNASHRVTFRTTGPDARDPLSSFLLRLQQNATLRAEHRRLFAIPENYRQIRLNAGGSRFRI